MPAPGPTRPHTRAEGDLPGVQVFDAGTHRGKRYTERDLDCMVENFNRFSAGGKPRLRVPAVIGHDETQEFLRRSDLPAAGWATRLYREGGRLYVDFADVPPQVRRLLKGRFYRTVSAEIYDEPPEGIEGGSGKMLRRVAFLGGDIPQLKSLDEIPVPDHFGELDTPAPAVLQSRHAHAMGGGCFAIFSEVRALTTDETKQALLGRGIDEASLAALSEPALTVLHAFAEKCDDMAGAYADRYMEDVDAGKCGDWPEPKDEAGKKKYAERARKYYEHAKKHFDRYCGPEKMAEPPPAKTDPEKKPEPEKMSEQAIAELVQKSVQDAVAAALGGAKAEVEDLKKFREETLLAEKRRAVDAFVERMGQEGRLAPAERESTHARLMRADARAVHKFTEAGKEVEGTDLSLSMREIERRPSLFTERVKGGQAKASPEDAEVATLEAHFDSFSEQFAHNGVTKESMVGAFRAERKLRPALTAQQFLNQ
jgi:hypothetical protein